MRLDGQRGRERERRGGMARREGVKRNEIKRNAKVALAQKSKTAFESIFPKSVYS